MRVDKRKKRPFCLRKSKKADDVKADGLEHYRCGGAKERKTKNKSKLKKNFQN